MALTFLVDGQLVMTEPAASFPRLAPRTYFPPMTGGWPDAYAGMYRSQLWVYVVVNKRALATARLPLPVYKHDDMDRPRVNDHPMAKLLRRPNPAMSGFDLWLWTSSTRDIFGESAWYKSRAREGGPVQGLYPLHPTGMSPNEDGSWDFSNGALRMSQIPPYDLVRFKAFDPVSTVRGMSAMEPLRATLENEWKARAATSSFWDRGARPSMALVTEKTLSRGAADRLKSKLEENHTGSVNTGSVLVLEEGLKPERMDLSAEEAQYIETRKLNREEVCAAYDVPPPVVHILDRATFSNITEQMRSMYRDTMVPHLKGFESAIESDLRAHEWPSDDIYAEFLMDEVLRGDFETRMDAYNKAAHMTIAEKRKAENLPFIAGTDRIFLNTATLPLDAIDAQAAQGTTNLPVPAPAEKPRSAGVADIRTLMGRLSWQKDLDEIDVNHIVEGLPPEHVAEVVRAYLSADTVDDLRVAIKALIKEGRT